MKFEYITAPLIGAIIGYFTNLIAVKMLFLPKNEIRIFGFKLPFTPGAIPKGKSRLARAIARTVSKNLVTKKDITERLLDKEAKARVLKEIKVYLDKTIKEDILSVSKSEEEYENIRLGVKNHLTNSLMNSLRSIELEEIISDETKQAIRNRTENSMLKIFLTEKVLNTITVPIKEETKKFVDIKAPLMFENEVEKKISDIEAQSIWDIISKTDLGSEKIEEMISNIYTEVINQGVDKFLEGIDVYGMVESKINDMGIDELEILVMSIMKKELDTIVNLGALIGFILGMINIFI